ncbi:hypothetical protein PTSG_01544 [Salpingoeca rosetta]|uniref:AB hydrolase-1 domain-containing protein n=1 Tax=Salpingoeca rosetta (strain ATCC 50818 / BSB-021) TaxID=946362 RepID=F2U0N2_SALR5|nr:uncharacterized protein PTSG_01544 [Salpingoeca rosetta]EGD80960.1 hypothetical protein PTSG_01544 [Salpingoeca rosetta]|eukprot:XP_004997521.1 hypothetical protein PTSG_01544 [Salpingoeca rosetta]
MEGHVTVKDVGVLGTRVRCYISPGAGPEVVLLHDAFSKSLQFRAQLNGNLGRQLRLIAIDLPGHGASQPPADVHRYYTVTGMAKIVGGCLEELGVRSAYVVGSGLGARVGLKLNGAIKVESIMMVGTAPLRKNAWQSSGELLARAPAVAKMADTVNLTAEDVHELLRHFVSPEELKQDAFAWVSHAIKHTDARHRNVVRHELQLDTFDELKSLSELSSRAKLGLVVGAHDHLVSYDYISSLRLPNLWRQCVQVVPGAFHFVGASRPHAFDALIRDLIKDTRGSITPIQRKVDPATAETPAGKSGALVPPAARFEPPVVEGESQAKPASAANTPMAKNPYARGKVPGGTMPHPSMRFEIGADEQPYAKEPVVHNPEMAANPHARGRIKGGVMPHPGARFEVTATTLAGERNGQNEVARKNPYARGRVPAGKMPHPSSRFEGQPEDDTNGAANNTSANATPSKVQNPYARGRIPGGEMPHPGARFEGHWIDRPSSRARQPPGGHTHSNIFG